MQRDTTKGVFNLGSKYFVWTPNAAHFNLAPKVIMHRSVPVVFTTWCLTEHSDDTYLITPT